jgi:hypothetical protein
MATLTIANPKGNDPMSDPTDDPAVTIPVLASLDLDATQTFYETRLGFAGERHGDYLILRRDRMEIHFWLTDNPMHPRNTSCYIRGGQVSALYEEYRARSIETLSTFAVRPWSMKEFYIHDPHGNLLRFGCAPYEIA